MDRKSIPLEPETFLDRSCVPALGPVDIDMPEGRGPARCHDAVCLTLVTAMDEDSEEKFMVLVPAADFNGELLGILVHLTAESARNLAASLIKTANAIAPPGSLD